MHLPIPTSKSILFLAAVVACLNAAGIARGAENPGAATQRRRTLSSNVAVLTASHRRQQEAWNRNFRYHRPRVKIESIRVPDPVEGTAYVRTLIYYPDIDLGSVKFFVDGKLELLSYSGQPNFGALLGTCSYDFSLTPSTLANGKHRLTVKDARTGDTDNRTVWIRGGRILRITK